MGANMLDQAIGVIPGEDGGVTLLTKKAGKANSPASQINRSTIPASRSTRKYVCPDNEGL
jgi:large subunit ribosomal protein L28e